MSQLFSILEKEVPQILNLIWFHILNDVVGDMILAAVVVYVTIIVAQRNHLDRRRIQSNVAQVIVGLVGWLVIGAYYNWRLAHVYAPSEPELVIIGYTVVLCLCFIVSILIAAAVKHYAINPFAQLRADIAGILIRLADWISDTNQYEKQRSKVLAVTKSIDLVEAVISERSLSNGSKGIG